MEKEEKKNNKTLIILLVVFGLIIVGLGVFIAYNKLYNSEAKPIEGKENTNSSLETESSKNDSKNTDSDKFPDYPKKSDIKSLGFVSDLLNEKDFKTNFKNLKKEKDGVTYVYNCTEYEEKHCNWISVTINNVVTIESGFDEDFTMLEELYRVNNYYIIADYNYAESGVGVIYTIYDNSGKKVYTGVNGGSSFGVPEVIFNNNMMHIVETLCGFTDDEEMKKKTCKENTIEFEYNIIDLSKDKISVKKVKELVENYGNKANEEKQNENVNENIDEEYSSSEYVIGILVKDYRPFDNVNFNNESPNEGGSYGRIEVKKDEIVFLITEFEEEVQSKKSIKANDVVSAEVMCDCGSCQSILYTNSKNELYRIDLHNDYKTTKIGDGYVGVTSNKYAYVYPSSCDFNDLILKNTKNELYIYGYENDIVPAKYLERTFVELAGNEDVWDKLIFIVSENAKVNKYLLDENRNNVHAKVVINSDEKIYIIDEEDNMYIYDDYKNNYVGKKYKNEKVKSYKISENSIEIAYTNNTKEKLTGDIFDKKDL